MSAMHSKVASLIQRVKSLVGTHRQFFDAVCEWYGNAQLAAKFARVLLAKHSTGARVSLVVNGHLLAGNTIEVAAGARFVSWVLPANALVGGINEIGLYRADTAGPPMYVQAATVFADSGLPKQTLDLKSARPEPTPQVELGRNTDATHRGDCWAIPKRSTLALQLKLREFTPVTLQVELYQDRSGLDFFKHILEDAIKDVLTRRLALDDRLRQLRGVRSNEAVQIEQQVRDLDAYARLHQRQISQAFQADDQSTLIDVIAKTGSPEQLIQIAEQPLTVVPAQPQPVLTVVPANPQPVLTVQPVSPRPRPSAPQPSSRPRPTPRKGSCLGTMFKLFVAFTLLAGGVGFWAWEQYVNVPDPTIQPELRIDSPVEGQIVGNLIPLQVWVSGQDTNGVKSLALAVQGDGADLVQGLPQPAQATFTFPSLAKHSGTKVFTLNLRQGAVPNVRTITLVATMVTKNGNTLTTTRNVRIGGNEMGMMFRLNPAEPSMFQPVRASVYVVNARPGASVAYSVKGTDGYSDAGTLTV